MSASGKPRMRRAPRRIPPVSADGADTHALLGRGNELALLNDLTGGARSRRGGALMIAGTPGVAHGARGCITR